MRIDVVTRLAERVSADAILGSFSLPLRKGGLGLEPVLRPNARRLLVRDAGALTWLEGHGTAAPRVLMVCLGGRGDRATARGWAGEPTDGQRAMERLVASRRWGAAVEHACHEQGVARLVVAPLPKDVDLGAFVDGIIVSAHQNREFRPQDADATLRAVTLCVPHEAREYTRTQVAQAQTIAECVNIARDLADLPANVGSPTEIASRVRALCTEVGLRVQVHGATKIEKLGMGLVAAVAQGSAHEARLVCVEHRPQGYQRLPTLVLLGKGVVHDTGGYNLKTTPLLHAFTDDKAGAAAVFAAMRAIAQIGVELHVIGVAALVENALDAQAYKPGDVLTAMDGTTVFVENTDAEGRLVLADCLTWVAQFDPRLVVDIATLTGASWAALGPVFSAMFSNSCQARDLVRDAGLATGEPVWPMPIHAAHDEDISHRLAQLRNSGSSAGAASVAAAFLRQFVDYPWAHIDMGGHASSQIGLELTTAGATGYGTRLLVEIARAAQAQWAGDPA